MANVGAHSLSGAVENPHTQKQADTCIIGRSEAVEYHFSYAVSLQSKMGHNCGGSLIANDVILTAAHCRGVFNTIFWQQNLNNANREVLAIRGELPQPPMSSQKVT